VDAAIAPSQITLPIAMGVAAHIGLVHLWFWRRRDAPHLWVGLWCLFTLAYQAARHVQLHTGSEPVAVASARILVAMGPLLVWSFVCFARSLGARPSGWRVPLGLLVPTAALSLAIVATPWFLPGATQPRLDWFGRTYIGVASSPALLVFLPMIVAALVHGAREIRSAPSLGRTERRVMIGSVGVYAALAGLSVLSSLRWLPFPPTVEYGPLVVALGLDFLLAHRHRRLHSRLEEMVDARTAEIAAAGRRLAESESRYRGLVESAPLGVFACDREGLVLAANPKLMEIVGSPARHMTRSINVLTYPPLVASGVAATLRRSMEEGGPRAEEHVYTSSWGKTSTVRLTAAPIRDDSERVTGALGIVEDIGELRALERRVRQSQKMESVGQLTAGIAHEINNPMAYVRSNLSMLRGEWEDLRGWLEKADLPEDATTRAHGWEELIDEALEGVDRVVAIVRDMREFSHAGDEERSLADLNQLVESSVRMAAPHRRGATRIEERYGEVPPLLCAPGPLRQVFLNLVVNALQAVGAAGHVRVSTGVRHGQVRVRVEDDGPGIDPGDQDRIFDPFFTTKAAGEGTGLGLYVSWQIVRLHGGDIRARSLPERGARFEVQLPLETRTDEAGQ
jgi:PAS domain S-box-containing protein